MVAKMLRSISFFITRAAFTSSFSRQLLDGDAFGDGDLAIDGRRTGFHAGGACGRRIFSSSWRSRGCGREGRLSPGRPRAGSTGGGARPGSIRPRGVGCCGRGPPGRPAGMPGRTPGLGDHRLAGANGSAINRLAGNGRAGRPWECLAAAKRAAPAWMAGERSVWQPDRPAAAPPDGPPVGRRECATKATERTAMRPMAPPGAGAPGRTSGRGRWITAGRETGPGIAAPGPEMRTPSGAALGGNGWRGPERIWPGRGAGDAGPGSGLAAGGAGRPGAMTATGAPCGGGGSVRRRRSLGCGRPRRRGRWHRSARSFMPRGAVRNHRWMDGPCRQRRPDGRRAGSGTASLPRRALPRPAEPRRGAVSSVQRRSCMGRAGLAAGVSATGVGASSLGLLPSRRLSGSAIRLQVGHIEPVQPAQLDGDVFVDGAGMRLLFRHAQFGEPIQNFVSLDFQLPRQLVDSNLLHRKSYRSLPPRQCFHATAPESGLLAAAFRGALFRSGPFRDRSFRRFVSGGTRVFYRTRLFRRFGTSRTAISAVSSAAAGPASPRLPRRRALQQLPVPRQQRLGPPPRERLGRRLRAASSAAGSSNWL